jgi:hypothetical protein
LTNLSEWTERAMLYCVHQIQIPIFFDAINRRSVEVEVRQLEFLYGNGWVMGLVNMEKITKWKLHQKVKFCIEHFQRYWGYRKK